MLNYIYEIYTSLIIYQLIDILTSITYHYFLFPELLAIYLTLPFSKNYYFIGFCFIIIIGTVLSIR
jgi:hypothetical protein